LGSAVDRHTFLFAAPRPYALHFIVLDTARCIVGEGEAVNCRLYPQFRYCIVVMLNRKSCLLGLVSPSHCCDTSSSARSSLSQLSLDEENLKTAGKQEEGSEKFNSVDGGVYTSDDEQEWPDSMFVPGLFQREDWPDSIFLPGHFQRQ